MDRAGIKKLVLERWKFCRASSFAYANSSRRDTIRPRRAVLYVPGHDRKKIDKLHSLNVDCAAFDCEDGVAVNKKEAARSTICEILKTQHFGSMEFSVRINSIQSGLARLDLDALLSNEKLPETLMIPKVDNVDHVEWISNELKSHLNTDSNKLSLILFVESSSSVLNLRDICQRAIELSQEGRFNLEGLVFGSDDFCADIGATRTEDGLELLMARQMIVMIAKYFKLQAIDMVDINYKDLTSLSKRAKEGADLGFTGKQVIHPSQVPIVQQAFSPSQEKIEWAKELIRLFEEHQREGKGAFTFRGAMIDKPLLLQAENILKVAEMCNN